MLGLNKMTSDLYQDVELEYGYLVTKKRPVLVKLLSSKIKEDE